MRFLILSCNTGEGHNSCGRAIKEYFEANGAYCEIRDALSFWSNQSSKIISKGHIFVYRNLPKVFGASYRFEENHPPKTGQDSLIYDILKNGCSKLYDYLLNEKYDGVISVHPFSAMMMTEIKKTKKISVPLYFVATDYTCSPGVNETDCDLYFIPHKDLIAEFVLSGIMREKIVASGIPVAQNFYLCLDKENAKKHLCLKPDERLVLLSCGSMGCGPIKELTEKLPDLLPSGVRLVVICGSNRRLYTALTKNGVRKNLTVIGYTSRMPLYMDAADLILTKPGGLSSTEGATKHKPMVFVNAVPGLETRNLNFFVERGFALSGGSVGEIIDIVNNCMMFNSDLEKVSGKIAENFSEMGAKIIYESILKYST